LIVRGEVLGLVSARHERISIETSSPAVGGLLIAATGPWLVFALDAITSIGVLIVLLRWRSVPRGSTLPAERFFSAIRVGLRFIAHTQPLQSVLIRGARFLIFASATWALFPLVVRQELQRGPEVYGLLLTCIRRRGGVRRGPPATAPGEDDAQRAGSGGERAPAQHERVSVADREHSGAGQPIPGQGESARSTHWLADS
jgi:hypothetical protein